MARRKNELNEKEVKSLQQESYIPTISFRDAFNLFIEDCEIKNLRTHTIQYYTNELRAFYKALKEHQITTDMAEFSYDDLKRYIKIQKDAGHKITSINTRLRALRAFFNFLKMTKNA
ncbi:site-specific integrase [Viridibacillus arvi]|uniref:site-specific integrase n=1 Tax=Viridibacillus arvi TaxID=263475 RepID=UPI003CFD63E0